MRVHGHCDDFCRFPCRVHSYGFAMTDLAAIQGNYADFKLVKTRSVCQLVIEIPIERAEQAIKAFGIPQPGSEIAVAVAKLAPGSVQTTETQEKTSKHEPPRERSRSPATTRAEKARRLCGVVQFQDWMRNRNGVQSWPPEWHSEPARYQQVSFWVKEYCGVQSKSELDNSENQSQSHDPAACWDMLLADYDQQTGRMAERH